MVCGSVFLTGVGYCEAARGDGTSTVERCEAGTSEASDDGV